MTNPIEKPWLEASLPLDERVELLLARMSLDELVGQTNMVANVDPTTDGDELRGGHVGSSLSASGPHAGNVRDRGVMASAIAGAQQVAAQSRLGIPVLFGRDVIHGHRTVAPIPLGQAAGWDEGLAAELAAVAADEASLDGVAWTFSPMCDITEDPRWGRIAETLGEAAELSGRLAAAMTRGYQSEDPSGPGQLAGCAKHFVGYGLATGGRDYETVQVGENTLRNLHLRPFKAAVDAGVLAVMASFNDIDGTPMHANKHLIRGVLKGEWGFQGLVVADWEGVGELVNHGVAADGRDAARQGIEAGVDLDMVSGVYRAHLADLVNDGVVPIELVREAARRVLRVKFRLGLFDADPVMTGSSAPSDDSRALARRAAINATVLVKNSGVLPLASDSDDAPTRLHVTGPLLEEGSALLGTWVLDGRGEDVASPLTSLQEQWGDRVTSSDWRFPEVVARAARQAEVTIALVGEHPSRSGEANSVTDIGLPAGQLEVLRELARVGAPLVVVVYTGRALAISELLDLADAVLVCFHPGIEAGPALAQVLSGQAEPGGRLPVTFPRSGGHIPSSHHTRRTSRLLDPSVDRHDGRYLDDLTLPRLPFGYGLGYADIEIGAPAVSAAQVSRDGELVVSVPVRNQSGRPGRQLVQLYLQDPVADITRAKVELLDWQWVEVGANSEASVEFSVSADQFGYVGRDLTRRVDTGVVRLGVGAHCQELDFVDVEVR